MSSLRFCWGALVLAAYINIYNRSQQTTKICFVPAAPIGDKTRKPKLLKPQPRKVVLVSKIHDILYIVYFSQLSLLFPNHQDRPSNHSYSCVTFICMCSIYNFEEICPISSHACPSKAFRTTNPHCYCAKNNGEQPTCD